MTAVFRTKGGAPGRYGRHVAALLSAPVGADMQADLARDLADVVDAARREQDPRLFMAASGRLAAVLAGLGVAARLVGGGEIDEPKLDAGELPPGLAEVLGAGPDVRDSEES